MGKYNWFNKDFNDPIIDKYEAFLKNNNIHISGIEFIKDATGQIYTYDVNTNTNYNSDAESIAEIYGMREITKYLEKELQKLK